MTSWKERLVACPGVVNGAAALALNSFHAVHMVTSLKLCILLVGMDLCV
jgi:hypothetical protein